MIVQLRMDERLIHGQITTAWSKALDINTILCANDIAANDPISKQALMLASPVGKKVAVRTVEDSIKLMKDPRADKMKVFVLVGNPQDALRFVKEFNLKEVNIANYMRKKSTGQVQICPCCQADEEDLTYFKEIALCCHVFSQLLPTSEYIELGNKLKEM